jgi:hypothetical protein
MLCSSCQSPDVHLIKVFAGHSQVSWSPVNGEKDIFGNYKNTKPLHAHACNDCGAVTWNVTIQKESDPEQTAQALDELAEADEDVREDPGFVLADGLDE